MLNVFVVVGYCHLLPIFIYNCAKSATQVYTINGEKDGLEGVTSINRALPNT